MSYRVYQVNKKTGVTYVYEATSYWDKEKKQPRNKQVCVGKLDPETDEFIPSKRLNQKQAAVRDPAVTVNSKIVGSTLILDKVSEDLGLEKVLKKCFPKKYKQILCMAYYLTCRGTPLSHCETWSKGHANPYEYVLANQRISEILKDLNEDQIQKFFDKWSKKLLENDYLCYDITSISSYSKLNEYVKYGYNRDHDKLPQINLVLLSGQKTQLPVYYRRLSGNINDVSTLQHFLKTVRYAGFDKLHLVMDRGLYSKNNVDALLKTKNKFIIAVPYRNKWIQNAIDEVIETIQNPEYYRKLDDEIIYVHSKLYPWGKKRHRCYLHLYFNPYVAAKVANDFTEKLLNYKEELETYQLVDKHEDAYNKFFIIKETPVRGRKILYNNEAIQKYRNKYAGFYVILTNSVKDPVKALTVYRAKDSVEKCFDDLKNQLDMKRLRIHSPISMDGRLFVQFISLIFMTALRRDMRKNGLINKYTVRELLEEMETLVKVNYSGKYGHILTETSKAQRHILETLDISLST